MFKRARNKVSGATGSGDLLTGKAEETAPVAVTKGSILFTGDAEEAAPIAGVMSEEEILELEAARIRQESEEDLYADDGGKAPRAADTPIIACDGTTWERHLHEDGREYFYCLDTGETQWVLPGKTEMAGNNEASGVGMGNVPMEEEPALGTTSSSSPTESFRAQQGSLESVNSSVGKDFSSTIGDSGLTGGGAAQTSGSPMEEGISELQKDTTGVRLDRERNEVLPEGDAAVRPAGSDDVIPNVEMVGIPAAEELVGNKVPGKQETTSEKDGGVGKVQGEIPDETSQPIAEVSAINEKDVASVVAGDPIGLPDTMVEAKARSTNEVRAKAQKITWSAEEARVGAHVVSFSADDCNNGAQVSVVTGDGGSQVDALVQPEVGGEEQDDLSRTGAKEAAVTDADGVSPLVTMEPKDPAVEESVPAADDKLPYDRI